MDLYFNKRLADFEARLQRKSLQTGAGPGPEVERTTPGHLITEACNRIYHRFRNWKSRGPRPQQGPQRLTPTEQATVTVGKWADQRWKTGKKSHKRLTTDEVVELAWQARWEDHRTQQRASPQRATVVRMADEDPPTLLFTDKALKRHDGLTKA